MPDGDWSVQDAKNRFGALVRAAAKAPQRITRDGKPAVVVLNAADYERLTSGAGATPPAERDFVQHLLSMPKDDGEFERLPWKARDIEF
jgi:prevent-host-death family protein